MPDRSNHSTRTSPAEVFAHSVTHWKTACQPRGLGGEGSEHSRRAGDGEGCQNSDARGTTLRPRWTAKDDGRRRQTGQSTAPGRNGHEAAGRGEVSGFNS